jgi:hypothetical protein
MAELKGTWRCTLFSIKRMRSLSISIKLEDLALFNFVTLKGLLSSHIIYFTITQFVHVVEDEVSTKTG